MKKPTIPTESAEISIEAAKEFAKVETIADQVPLQVIEEIGSAKIGEFDEFLRRNAF